MRSVWIALVAVLVIGLLGAFLLSHAFDKAVETKPSLAPRGARVFAVRPLSDSQRVLSWQLGGHPEAPSSGVYGVTVVEGQTPLYTHRAREGAMGIRVEARDFSGDGRADLLVFDEMNTSCGTYRALVTSPGRVVPVATRSLCAGKGSIHLGPVGLVVRSGSTRTVLRWNGRRLVVVR
jgi:hypothetical protein